MRQSEIDAVAASSGTAASAWNFLIGGEFNTLLGAIVGVLSVLVLVQRWRINRRELDK